MRIGRITKSMTASKFMGKYGAKEKGVFTVKGTDAIIIKSPKDSYWYGYSKNTGFSGGGTYDRDLHDHLYNLGYTNRMCLYGYTDWEIFMRRIRNSSFTREHVESLIKQAIKGTSMTKPKQRFAEYGVELELETPSPMTAQERATICESSSLIHDVGGDPSVHNGCEIRFNHPAISGWKMKDIKLIMNTAKSFGATNERGTAGMHIHISRKDIRDIVTKFQENLPVMQQILYPTNCRKLKLSSGANMYYGVEANIFRNQLSDFGTLEIRAWNATVDAKLFLARIKFCQYLCNWLAKATEITVEKFFDSLSGNDKRNYMYMVNHKENPHEWGMPLKAINAMLA